MEKGLLDTYEAEAELKTALVEQASKVALLVDHSKFDRTAFIKFIDYSDLDYVVTDQKPSKEWMDFFQKRAIQIIFNSTTRSGAVCAGFFYALACGTQCTLQKTPARRTGLEV